MKTNLPVIEDHAFQAKDFVGGHVALDFANTITGWNAVPRDWIASYTRLAQWSVMAGLLEPREAAILKKKADVAPNAAAKALADAKAQRIAVHDYFSAIARAQAPTKSTIGDLVSRWRQCSEIVIPTVQDGRLVLNVGEGEPSLHLISQRVAWRAFELARDVDPGRLRICCGDECGWLFVDGSKGGRRCWCDMATCGNVAKARRFASRRAPVSRSQSSSSERKRRASS